MKISNNIKKLFWSASAILILGSCSDFLERTPLDKMTDLVFFKQESDLKFYMNGCYGNIIRNQGFNRWHTINGVSDDCLLDSQKPSGQLMQHANSGLAGLTHGGWNSSYDYIRTINYAIEHGKKIPNLSRVGKHYLGEAHFCRAYQYFQLLRTFGGVPYIDRVLNTNDKDLYKPRESRRFIAEKILADLDTAIVYMDWKNEGEAVEGRLNKESAMLLKTRVALFEGSWEYYHGRKKTPFAMAGSDGKLFLEQVVETGKELIDHLGDNLWYGPEGMEYFDLFRQNSYKTIPSAFLYKVYDIKFNLTHYWEGSMRNGCLVSITKNAVDSYLMKDGKPREISSIVLNDETATELCAKKDPRLGQTIWCPSKGLTTDYWPDCLAKTSYAGITSVQQPKPSITGYRVWKGASLNPSKAVDIIDDTDDLIFRYEEVLLNYAEAKAILGTITQEDLDISVNHIRARAKMPAMNLQDINSWNISYDIRGGYDLSAPNIVNELRRERRVEMILEGLRIDDIKRWAMFDDVFNGMIPLGAYAKDLTDYWNDDKRVIADGFTFSKPNDFHLVKGENYDEIDGYINPYFRHQDFKKGGQGYYINPERDYLGFIPTDEIRLYKEKADVVLTQNPGWF